MFVAGDNLIFQLESGFGLMRVLAVDEAQAETIWHLTVFEDFYPDIETAERALEHLDALQVRRAHLALSTYALEKTPAAKLDNQPLRDEEANFRRTWEVSGSPVANRSVLLMLGLR